MRPVFLAILACSATAVAGEIRTWKAVNGSTVDAAFVSYEAPAVVLEKADGTRLRVDRKNLSDDDWFYVAETDPAILHFRALLLETVSVSIRPRRAGTHSNIVRFFVNDREEIEVESDGEILFSVPAADFRSAWIHPRQFPRVGSPWSLGSDAFEIVRGKTAQTKGGAAVPRIVLAHWDLVEGLGGAKRRQKAQEPERTVEIANPSADTDFVRLVDRIKDCKALLASEDKRYAAISKRIGEKAAAETGGTRSAGPGGTGRHPTELNP